MPRGPHKQTHTLKLCMNLYGTNNLTLSASTQGGHSSARKKIQGCNIFIKEMEKSPACLC